MPISERSWSSQEAHAAVRALLERTTVSELMTSPVHCARESMTCDEVARTMMRHGISALPVLDEKDAASGIITKSDVVRCQESQHEVAGQARLVIHSMTHFVLKLRPSDTLNDAVHLMTNAGVHHLVVIDDAHHVKGIVSSLDLLHLLAGASEAAALDEDVGISVSP